MNSLPKVAFSHRPSQVDWSNTRLTDAPLAEEIPRLKHSLIRERFIDEYRLTIHRSLSGTGSR